MTALRSALEKYLSHAQETANHTDMQTLPLPNSRATRSVRRTMPRGTRRGRARRPLALFHLCKRRNYSPRMRWSRACNHVRSFCQGVADSGESAPSVAAAGFNN
jgi:hypothetical protein